MLFEFELFLLWLCDLQSSIMKNGKGDATLFPHKKDTLLNQKHLDLDLAHVVSGFSVHQPVIIRLFIVSVYLHHCQLIVVPEGLSTDF